MTHCVISAGRQALRCGDYATAWWRYVFFTAGLVAGWAWAGAGWAGWAGLGWAGLGCPETGTGLLENEIGLFENGKVSFHRKNVLLHGQQQQAISIYFFLEGLGFRV